MQMPFSRLAIFAVAPAGLMQLRYENWQRSVQILEAGAVFTVCMTLNLQKMRLVRQLWHYTTFTVEKTTKTGPACSVWLFLNFIDL